MWGAVKLTVNLSREQTCFAYINIKYCTNAQETECVRVQVGAEHLYLWVVYHVGVNEDCILLDPLHCRVLGLSLFQDVYVSAAHSIRPIDSLLIEADSFEDQVILEHNQAHLQTVFLNHVRLVVANQKAVVWLSPSIPIVFTPKQTGILVNHTKVIVTLIDEQSLKSKENISSLLNPLEEEEKKNSINAAKGLLRSFFSLPKKMALRALPMEGDGKKVLIHPFVVFIHQDLVEPEYKESNFLVALIKGLPPTNPSNSEEVDNNFCWQHEICVKVIAVNSVVYRSLSKEVYSEYIPTVLIPHSLNEILDLYKGTMIMLTFINSQTLRPPQHIEIVTYNRAKQQECPMTLVEKFKSTVMEYFHAGEVFLINHDLVMQNSELSTGFIKFKLKPEGLAYTKLTKEIFQICTVSGQSLDVSDMKVRKPVVSMTYDYKNYCRTIKPLELLIEKVMSHIYFDIHREARFNRCSDLKSGVLVTGQSGTGKTTLCNLIEKEISVFSYILRCRPLKGRKDIWSAFADAVLTCAYRKPALLILDDLDALLPSNMEGLSPQDIALYNRLAIDIKQRLFLYSGVSVLMTARVVSDLHPTFRVLTGQPLFTAQFQMPELNQDDRVQLFKHILSPQIRNSYLIDVDDVIRLAMDSNGYSFREIIDYFNKKLYAAVKKKNANPKGPKQRIVEDVTKDIDKAKAFDIWGPLGGMEPVKEKLNECIFWPVMYPALFPSQGCGILLYGPPGTGKSLIGSCLARLKGFNMITVKGPELLSKYIGQSEAAVREVFDKADMKRPCILFFDEFDSLAPRRGHDSTGVTDRVVNQLLARLDGAEGGARGPVLAATSRPDLVDPALLRTGRLATHIHCDLPTLDGRLEVLQTIAQDFHLRESVKLDLVAEATEGYSPADLKSLLVTAQLSRLDLELLQISFTDDKDEPTLDTVVITTDDINHALAETKPSLSLEQRQFYDDVYRRFRGEGYPNNVLPKKVSTILEVPRMRVTLA